MLIFCDSFDHYTTITNKWDAVSNVAGVSIHSDAGRNGTNGLKFELGYQIGYSVQKNLPLASTYIVGTAVYIPGNVPNADTPFLSFREGSINHVVIHITADGHLKVYRNTTLLSTSVNALSFDTSYYIEVKATINDSTGAVIVRVNGVDWVNISAVDTQNGGSGVIGNILIGNFYSSLGAVGVSVYLDDLYICDTAGSYNNNFLGDIRVETLLPDGGGSNTDWTPSAGSNYDCVNESAPNSDTDYVYTSNVNDTDSYTYSDLTSATGSVKAAVVWAFSKKDDGGTRLIRAVAKSGATTGDNGSDLAPGTSYSYLQGLFEINPDTSSEWTISEINGAEFGVKVVS